MHPLDGARAKLDRSKQHLVNLRWLWDREMQSPDIRSTQEYEQHEGKRYLVSRVHNLPTLADNPRFSLVAGDAMHNARSALDHLIYALVEANGSIPTRRNEFPIWEHGPKDSVERRTFANKLKGLRPDHAQGIRALQPFSDPKNPRSRRLAHLEDLDNLDKHRLLVPSLTTVVKLADAEARLSPVRSFGSAPEYNVGPIKSGDWFVRTRSGPLPTAWLTATGFAMAFGDEHVELETLNLIRDDVVGIVESYALDLSR